MAFEVAAIYESEVTPPEPMVPPRPPELPPEAVLSAADQRAYAGEYRSRELNATHSIILEAQGLSIVPGDQASLSLRNLGADKMLVVISGLAAGDIKFKRNAGADIVGFELNAPPRATGVRFERIN